MNTEGIGARVLRLEDERFITGKGQYVDDVNLPGQLYAQFVRSPLAHAEINGINTGDAEQADGVVAVYTGEDIEAAGLGGFVCGWTVYSKDGSEMIQPPYPVLAQGKVRFVGQPVAVVIAENKQAARDAAELVDVDYDELDAVVDALKATQDGAPQLHDEADNNYCFRWAIGDEDATKQAFERASHVASIDLINNRVIPNAMEPRAALGNFDPGSGDFTLYTTSQNPHLIRMLLTAFIGIAPEHKLRVVAPDVGGGFGSKIYLYSEETVCLWAAGQLKRPVKWTADRSESFLADAQGRDHVSHAELAMDDDGKFLGLKVHTTANLGAYLNAFGSAVPTFMYATLLSGQYATPAIYAEVDAVFTNTTPTDAYRGAGRPEATYLLERLVDVAAAEMGMDPADIRRRNYIQPDQFPYDTPVGVTYDIGDYESSLDKALELSDYKNFDKRKKESSNNGKLRGIGLSSYIEACGVAPSQIARQLGAAVGLFETAQVQVNPTGSIAVLTGTHSHGQGHETTFAQIVAERLGVPLENIDIVHGDTATVSYGVGTYGSRSLPVGGSALVRAVDKIIEKGKRYAAAMLEASESDIEFADGEFKVAGTDKSLAFGEVAFAAYAPPPDAQFDEDMEFGLNASAVYDPVNFTYPAGTYVCEVEVDPDTGIVDIVRFLAVDDFGNVINPMIVEGQVHGGVAQGIGQAMMERAVYDPESGQPVAGSYMDYCMPRADDFPMFEVDMTQTACTHNPLGAKGCGEAGAIGSPPAFINAVCNALDLHHLEMPATPERVWNALRTKQKAA